MNSNFWFLLVLFVFAIGFLLGSIAGRDFQRKYMEIEAIEFGCAEYDSKTGQWGWK